MTLDEFRQELINDIAVERETVGGFSETIFTERASEALEAAGVIDHFEVCGFRDVKGKYKFAGYAFDELDSSLTVCVSDWSGTSVPKVLAPKDARSQFKELTEFLNAIVTSNYASFIDQGDAAFDFARTLRERLPALLKIRALLLTDSMLSVKVKDWPEGDLEGVPMEFYIWDIVRFHNAAESASGLDEIEVSFEHIPGGGLPCLKASLGEASYQGYLAVLPASELARIYDTYGSRLLEGNVRSFLSTKGKVNQGIRRTLLTNSSMFFSYNNGISCVATRATIDSSNGMSKITSITNLQIVNGGQTTASIAACAHEDRIKSLGETFVPMKLSIVEGDSFSTLMKDISLYANSQNKVSDADLASNDPFQIRIEEMSRRILAPAVKGNQYNTHWYYERARGQYANEFYALSPRQRESQRLVFPKSQLITKQDLARSVLSWGQQPYVVALGSQRIIMEFSKAVSGRWEKDRAEFNDQYFKDRISELIIYRQFEAKISSQSWYIVGYKAIIAAYAIAWLSAYLESHKLEIDVDIIWRNQEASDVLIALLLKIGEALFAEMFVSRDGRAPNVTQLAKRQALWTDLKKYNVAISISNVPLLEKGARRADLSSARTTRGIDDDIEAQSFVIGKGNQYWLHLLSWFDAHGQISAFDRTALVNAGDQSKVPSEGQANRLMALRKRANSLGFVDFD